MGRPPLNPRMVLNGILWMLRTGARWRDLPARYGKWNSIYHKFRQWCERGLFQLLLQSVTADADNSTLLEIDSTFCKVHQSACSGLRNQAIGASRGGKNTKIHVLLNEKMQLLSVILTGEHIHDSQSALDLFVGVDLAGKKVLADKAYSCQSIRDYLEKRGAVVCIPDKTNFKMKHAFDSELYKQRNLVERFLNFILLSAAAIHF